MKSKSQQYKALRRRALWFLAQQMSRHNITPLATPVSHIIVMGVSGCGKSRLASALAKQLGWPMIEGDDFHPACNVAKMSAGIALNDTDRMPWLALLNQELRQHPNAVLACSALKQNYRTLLRTGLPNAALIHAHGSYETLLSRMQSRSEHFMPSALLQSQFDALETPTAAENSIGVNCEQATHFQLAYIIERLNKVTYAT